MRNALILVALLIGLGAAWAQTATDMDEMSKVAYCYGALTQWQMLHPLPAECTSRHANSAVCRTQAKYARKIGQFIAYLRDRMFASQRTFSASELAQDKGEADATNCKQLEQDITGHECSRADACLTMNPPH
jgi:hypothetical protein